MLNCFSKELLVANILNTLINSIQNQLTVAINQLTANNSGMNYLSLQAELPMSLY